MYKFNFFFLVFLFAFFISYSWADNNKKNITLISSNALSGPTGAVGKKLTQGANVYFDKINQQGGIAGRFINLITYDDGYEPYKTIKNTNTALTTLEFLAFFNYMGTPNSYRMLPIIAQEKIPYLTPFTGAKFLRDPVNPYIFNLRASYDKEAEAQIEYLINKVKAKKIALLVQADKFGSTVERGYVDAMNRRNISPVVTTRYRRNTNDIDLALNIMIEHNVDAIAFVGTYEPLTHFIEKAYQKKLTPFYSTVSFISSHHLFAGVKVPANILVTEVVPNPRKCTFQVCKEFRQDIKNYNNILPEEVVFEGYLNAKLFVEVAQQCDSELTRACLLDKFNHFKSDFGGLKVNFTPENHQGLKNIYYSFFKP